MKSNQFFNVFEQVILDYHIHDSIEKNPDNPFDQKDFRFLLYQKNWIDTVQWHLEDIIRDPEIDPVEALKIKRIIDASNQKRTDLVEYIDGYFLEKYKSVKTISSASINTETIAWAIDRLSILALKIYHMKEESERQTADENHKVNCLKKLDVLNDQRKDLCSAIDQLIEDIESGKKYIKVYKQMKMYNDEDLNPVLYKSK
jgi:hypothetical protein